MLIEIAHFGAGIDLHCMWGWYKYSTTDTYGTGLRLGPLYLYTHYTHQEG
jgi:hypothetical protein